MSPQSSQKNTKMPKASFIGELPSPFGFQRVDVRSALLDASGRGYDADCINRRTAATQQLASMFYQIIELHSVETWVAGTQFKGSFHAENNSAIAAFNLPFLPTSQNSAIIVRTCGFGLANPSGPFSLPRFHEVCAQARAERWALPV